MKIEGLTISEYFAEKQLRIIIGAPNDNSSLAAWVPRSSMENKREGNFVFCWLTQMPIRSLLVRLQRMAVVSHARKERQDKEFQEFQIEREKQEALMHTVPKPRLNVRRVRRIAAPTSQ
jgi:hypothetical protein